MRRMSHFSVDDSHWLYTHWGHAGRPQDAYIPTDIPFLGLDLSQRPACIKSPALQQQEELEELRMLHRSNSMTLHDMCNSHA